IYSRAFTPKDQGDGAWSETLRISDDAGTDFHVVSTTDSTGRVWLAWQGWRDGGFAVLLKPVGTATEEELTVERQMRIGPGKGNYWNPALAADSDGNVYLAYDSYERGSYDIFIRRFRLDGVTASSAGQSSITTPAFEARPHILCDDADRLWIAYESGDEQWGKDYQGDQPEKVGLENKGFGLYVTRTVKVACVVDGKLMQPSADLQKVLDEGSPRSRSVPRLARDDNGGLWLLYRHHLNNTGRGEAWVSHATRFDGQSWSTPEEVPHSSNLIDNRPALVSFQKNLLAVYSSDTRQNTRNRQQNDLFATILTSGETAGEPELQEFTASQEPELKPVHPNEAADVARVRDFKVEVGDKTLRLWRGEFHRHTEYTAHRDQDGLLEDSLRYALDAGRLDWMGNGDHDNGSGHEYCWWQIQKHFDLMHNPPGFCGVMSYERSVRYPSGHRNVILPQRGIRPLPRLRGQQNTYGTAEEGAPDVKMLYQYLKHFDGICASHTSA
ncbi:MAG: hypothetical protein ACREIV_08395, partial [Planctomycetaceae bacterium]